MDDDSIATLSERVETLEASVVALTARNTPITEERERYHALYLQLLEINERLERGLLGQKAERLPADEAQLTLQLLATLLGDRAIDCAISWTTRRGSRRSCKNSAATMPWSANSCG